MSDSLCAIIFYIYCRAADQMRADVCIYDLINFILHFISWQKDFAGEISFILTPPPQFPTGFNN